MPKVNLLLAPGRRVATASGRDERGVQYGLILQTEEGEAEAGGGYGEAQRLRALLRGCYGMYVGEGEMVIVRSECDLLLALAAAVQRHDVDLFLSWDARRCATDTRVLPVAKFYR